MHCFRAYKPLSYSICELMGWLVQTLSSHYPCSGSGAYIICGVARTDFELTLPLQCGGACGAYIIRELMGWLVQTLSSHYPCSGASYPGRSELPSRNCCVLGKALLHHPAVGQHIHSRQSLILDMNIMILKSRSALQQRCIFF